jgi:hypothetical protein
VPSGSVGAEPCQNITTHSHHSCIFVVFDALIMRAGQQAPTASHNIKNARKDQEKRIGSMDSYEVSQPPRLRPVVAPLSQALMRLPAGRLSVRQGTNLCPPWAMRCGILSGSGMMVAVWVGLNRGWLKVDGVWERHCPRDTFCAIESLLDTWNVYKRCILGEE